LPRYDYRCTSCGHQFELRQSFSAATVQECPICGADSNRKIHAPPVIFKGSGWYVNDYGKGRGNNGVSSEKSAEQREKKASSAEKSSSSTEGSNSKTASASKAGAND
jgi:putative FmdB family regulatory protein